MCSSDCIRANKVTVERFIDVVLNKIRCNNLHTKLVLILDSVNKLSKNGYYSGNDYSCRI